MSKSCKVQLDRLFDHPLLESTEKSVDKAPEEMVRQINTAAKSCRLSRIPSKLSNFDCGKLSGHCPGCRTLVNDGEKGVVCKKCKAYWHYGCANVTQEEIDTQWKEDFVCEAHRLEPKKDEDVLPKFPGSNSAHPICGNSGEQVLLTIKINTYAIDKVGLIKFKLSKMEAKSDINEKACHRQHTIKVNSLTYQILVENFVSFGERLGVKPKRHDIDSKGDSTQDQYEMNLGNSNPVSVTYYHTTNNILVQLKGEKDLKGAKKAAKLAERIQQLRRFVNDDLKNLINKIEQDETYESLQTQMTSNLKLLLEDIQECVPKQENKSLEMSQATSKNDEKLSPQKSIETNNICGTNDATPSSTPRRKSGKRCNDECDKVRTCLNQRVSRLEREKTSIQQKYETIEKHQESLRSTISSKEGLIEAQTKIITDHLTTITSQKQLISDMEIKSTTHSELATSFLTAMMTEEDDNDTEVASVKENHILQQMHEKIKHLESQVTSNIEKITEVEKERDSVKAEVVDLKGKLNKKTKEFNGLKSQLSTVEEVMLSKENELKSLQSKLSDGEVSNESLRIENSRLGSMLVGAERKIGELTEKAELLQVNDNSNPLVNQLMNQLTEKDFEIKDLKETIEFTEAAAIEAKSNWKEETATGKRLQDLLNEEKKLRIHLEEDCKALQYNLAEEKVKLQRSKALLDLTKNKTAEHSENEGKTDGLVVPIIESELGIQTVSSASVTQESRGNSGIIPCIFELTAEGSCMRKEKCKFDHELASSFRNDPNAVSRLLSETSQRTGKCAFEMTRKGSCPSESICNTTHNLSHPEGENIPRRICFRELMKKGSCSRGDNKCRFSHKISDEERTNGEFIRAQRKVKDEKASKCVNEFRQKGYCRRKDKCPFSHKISEDDRGNESLKKSMEERVGIILKKKDETSQGSHNTIQDPVEFMKSMLLLKKEVHELMEKIKVNVNP